MNTIMDYILKPTKGQPSGPATTGNVSDEESLEDHSALEDFHSVTLQLDDNDTGGSRSPTPGSVTGFSFRASDKARYEQERLALFGEGHSSKPTLDLTNINPDGGHVPRIAITPMTPPSGIVTPEANSTISLSSTLPSPSCMNGFEIIDGASAMYQRPQQPLPGPEDIGKDFFAYRDAIMQAVVNEVLKLRDPKLDGDVRGTWLLTEIDHWDNEKERIVILCTKSVIIVKYDFIGMKEEEHRRIYLCIVDTIIQGELKYPERSLTPRISGIAGGLVGVVKDCIIPKVQGTVSTVGNVVLYRKRSESPDCVEATEEAVMGQEVGEGSTVGGENAKRSIMSALSLDNFEPRVRNVKGVRISWNQDLPLSFTQKWNPFDKSIPWLTFTYHPLFWHKGGGMEGTNRSFDVECFARDFIDILSQSNGDASPSCRVEYKPIIIETYVGLASFLHNANNLGFYKVRGKVSF